MTTGLTGFMVFHLAEASPKILCSRRQTTDVTLSRPAVPFRSSCARCGTAPAYCWSMIFSENRYPPRIKSGAGFFGIML